MLIDGWREAGDGVVVWDGRDASGRPAAGGTYLLDMKTGRQRATGRVVLVR